MLNSVWNLESDKPEDILLPCDISNLYYYSVRPKELLVDSKR